MENVYISSVAHHAVLLIFQNTAKMPGPNPNATADSDPLSRAWLTLVTRASYLPGLAVLVDSLYKHGSKHPLIVQYTTDLPEDCIKCLQLLHGLYPLCLPQRVESIPLPDGLEPVAARFADTLTKLRAFQPLTQNELDVLGLPSTPKEICFLDADILIMRNLDDIFDVPRPGSDWVASHHACVCNVDGDPLAPPEYSIENCPFTRVEHPEALEQPVLVPETEAQKKTYALLNSGVFVCTPSQELWQKIQDFFTTNEALVKTFKFPDQNFMEVFFQDKWVPLGWQYNAIKTHRYWHSAAWRDDEVRALHYIIDKPWEVRTGKGDAAGYLGRDGVTHSWWWAAYDQFVEEMARRGDVGRAVVACVSRYADVAFYRKIFLLISFSRTLNPADSAQRRVGGRELLARLGRKTALPVLV